VHPAVSVRAVARPGRATDGHRLLRPLPATRPRRGDFGGFLGVLRDRTPSGAPTAALVSLIGDGGRFERELRTEQLNAQAPRPSSAAARHCVAISTDEQWATPGIRCAGSRGHLAVIDLQQPHQHLLGAAGARHREPTVPLPHERDHDLETRDRAVGDFLRTEARASDRSRRRLLTCAGAPASSAGSGVVRVELLDGVGGA
jgi:hypothetical protein